MGLLAALVVSLIVAACDFVAACDVRHIRIDAAAYIAGDSPGEGYKCRLAAAVNLMQTEWRLYREWQP